MTTRSRSGIAPALTILVLALLAWGVAFAQEAAQPTPNPADFAPETVELSGLKQLWGPVTFTHKAHFGYTGDCATCHHHSAAGEYPACGECHSPAKIKSAKQRTIGLKAAYHRQCMDCHKEMGSGPMECADCHEKLPAPAKPAGPTN